MELSDEAMIFICCETATKLLKGLFSGSLGSKQGIDRSQDPKLIAK